MASLFRSGAVFIDNRSVMILKNAGRIPVRVVKLAGSEGPEKREKPKQPQSESCGQQP